MDTNLQDNNLSNWFRFSLFNLVLIALLGTLMRYKIGFEFPFLSQKHLLHAHSHFAFTGWITHTLMVLMVISIRDLLTDRDLKTYKRLFAINLVSAYGMFIAFIAEGYGPWSISFSVLSILVSYTFAGKFVFDIRKNGNLHPARNWFKAALFFNILSTAGTYALVYMMITKSVHLDYYLAAVYYFLHFQYNGWFFFACMGLFWNKIRELHSGISGNGIIFHLFFWSCIPAYFLSTLWMKFPVGLFVLIVAAAGSQLVAWTVMVIRLVKIRHAIKSAVSKFGGWLFIWVAVTLTVKLLLQLFSTIPVMSKLAFGFRPIVIAYLHLVLLAILSMFLIAWLHSFGHIKTNKLSISAIALFLAGVFLNEFALMVQGIASFAYFPVPFINEILFAVAAVMLAGAVLLFISQNRNMADRFHTS